MKIIHQQSAEPRTTEYRRKRRWHSVVTTLAAIVVFCTTYALILPAITWERSLVCEVPEHTHGEQCYTVNEESGEKELTCTLAEHSHTDACFDAPPASEEGYYCGNIEHVHSKGQHCYYADGSLRCTLKEHRHTLACKSNPKADVENAKVWCATFKDATLTDDWPKNVLAIAETQVGYHESSQNYQVKSNSTTKAGYSRYGAWYGVPYGDWCAMFCSFCLHYAGVDDALMPQASSCSKWISRLSNQTGELERPLYHPRGSYSPKPGDLVFIDWDASSKKDASQSDPLTNTQLISRAMERVDHVGIVSEVIAATDNTPAQIRTIEGNLGNAVARSTYKSDCANILGYGELPQNPALLRAKANIQLKEATVCSQPASDGAVAEISGNLPVGAKVQIEPVKLPENDLLAYFGEERAEIMKSYAAYDIKILADGEVWEPEDTVSVVVKQPDIVLENGDSFGVDHVLSDNQVAHVANAAIEVEKSNGIDRQEMEVSFETESFSVYVLYTYTVDFRFADCGMSLDGDSSIFLSTLLENMGIHRDVSDVWNVTFSDPSLLAVQKMRLGNWLLTSLEPFQTEETLTIEFNDGVAYVFTVTDDQSGATTYWQKVTKASDINSDGTYMILAAYTGDAFGAIKSGRTTTVISDDPDFKAVAGEDNLYSTTIGNDYWWTFTGNTTSTKVMNVGQSGYGLLLGKNNTDPVSNDPKNVKVELRNTDKWIFYRQSSGKTYNLIYGSGSFWSVKDGVSNYNNRMLIYKLVDRQTDTTFENGTYSIPYYTVKVDSSGAEVGAPVLQGILTLNSTTNRANPQTLCEDALSATGLNGMVFKNAYYGRESDQDGEAPTIAVNNITGITYSNSRLTFATSGGNQNITGSNENALYLQYGKKSTRAGDDMGVSMDISKTIDYLGDAGSNPDTNVSGPSWYRLYLDGQFETDPPIDLIFVVDVSGSMSNNGGATAVTNFLNGTNGQDGFIDSFLNACDQNRYSIVKFSGDTNSHDNGATRSYTASQYTSYASVLRDWGRSNADVSLGTVTGGTNYNAGIFRTEDQIAALKTLDNNAVDQDRKRIIIFLSDGAPTFANIDKTSRTNWGTGSNLGTSGSNVTKTAISNFRQNYCTDGVYNFDVYGIAFGQTGNDFDKTYLQLLADGTTTLESGVESRVYAATNADDIASIFTKALYPQNVCLTDNLSVYTQWGQDKSDPKVTMDLKNDPNDEPIVLYENGMVTEAGQGKLQDVVFTRGNVAEKSTGTIQAIFEPTYALDPLYKYTLSFNVQNASYATDEYIDNDEQYLDRGGQDVEGDNHSDYGGNNTSYLHGGFHSNRDANIYYTVGDTEFDDGYYHPVVQAAAAPEDAVEKRDIEVKKVWSGTGTHPDSVSVTLYQDDEVYGTSVLNASNNWTDVYERLPVENEMGDLIDYTIVEEAPAGYRVAYASQSITEEASTEIVWIGDDADETVDELEPGEQYLLVYGNNVLSRNGGNLTTTSLTNARNNSTNALWTATEAPDGMVYLSNGNYFINVNTSATWSGRSTATRTCTWSVDYRLSTTDKVALGINDDGRIFGHVTATNRDSNNYYGHPTSTIDADYYFTGSISNSHMGATASVNSGAVYSLQKFTTVEHPGRKYTLLTATNTRDTTLKNITLQKVDMAGNLITDSSAEFELYSDSEYENLVGVYSTENGVVAINNLVVGNSAHYWLLESTPPDGYEIAPNAVEFYLNSSGNVVIVNDGGGFATAGSSGTLQFKNNSALVSITIQKKVDGTINTDRVFSFTATLADDVVFPEPEEGAKYTVDENNVAHFQLHDGEQVSLMLMPDSELTITETDSDGYYVKFESNGASLPGAVKTLEVSEDEMLIVHNVVGEPLPSTGGMGVGLFYVLGTLLTAGGLWVLVLTNRKGKRECR